jgi:hypothetical protein
MAASRAAVRLPTATTTSVAADRVVTSFHHSVVLPVAVKRSW